MKDKDYEALLKGGGPAFPVSWQENDGQHVAVGGMTLRDYFAGRAMQGLIDQLAEHLAEDVDTQRIADALRNTARLSYVIAAAMLREREQAQERGGK